MHFVRFSIVDKETNKDLVMKKARFMGWICLFMLITSVSVYGQATRLTFVPMNDAVNKTIIRECNYPATISYVETTSEHFFIYNSGLNGNIQVISVPISTLLGVNDFVIKGDTVFFCGVRSGNGFIGFFCVNDFFFSTHNFQLLASIMPSVSGTVTSLNKMVLYSSNGIRELVAIGKTSTGLDCVTVLQETSSMWTFQVGELPASYNESILDITVTDNYVITAGFRNSNPYYPSMRAYEKAHIFSSSGFQNTSFISIPFNNNTCDYDCTQLILTHIQSDTFALAAYWKPHIPNTVTTPNGVYVGKYTVQNSTLGNNEIAYNSGVRVYMVYGSGGWKLRGMTKPASNTSAFYLLHDSEFSVQAPVSMVLELPYNSFYTLIPSTVMISYNPQIQFQSIDAYYNNTQCVMNGYSIPNPLELMFYQQFASLGDICLYHSNVPYYNPGMSEKNNILPFNVTSFSPISFFTVNAQSAENTLGHTVCP